MYHREQSSLRSLLTNSGVFYLYHSIVLGIGWRDTECCSKVPNPVSSLLHMLCVPGFRAGSTVSTTTGYRYDATQNILRHAHMSTRCITDD